MNTSDDTQAVLDVVGRWARAEQANDAEARTALLSEEFVGVGPLGFVLSRDQWLGRFRGGLENRALAVEHPKVHGHGGTAEVVGVLAKQTHHQGRDNSGRVTVVADRPDDTAHIGSVHIDRLQQTPAAAAGQGEMQ